MSVSHQNIAVSLRTRFLACCLIGLQAARQVGAQKNSRGKQKKQQSNFEGRDYNRRGNNAKRGSFTSSTMTNLEMRESYVYWVKAFTEPSLEYWQAYLKVSILLGLIAVGLYFFLSPEKQTNVKVSLDEVTDQKPGEASDEKKKSKSGKKKKGDTNTQDTTKAETEGGTGEYRTMSLKREIDRKGPFQ